MSLHPFAFSWPMFFLYIVATVWLFIQTGVFVSTEIRPSWQGNPLFWPFWTLLWSFLLLFLYIMGLFVMS